MSCMSYRSPARPIEALFELACPIDVLFELACPIDVLFDEYELAHSDIMYEVCTRLHENLLQDTPYLVPRLGTAALWVA